MLRRTKDMKGRALRAADGVIGEVKDLYFDDRHWHVRYLVVEANAWGTKRQVLISPDALGTIDWGIQAFPVNLTTEQVRNSPGIDTDKPVSRQYEERLRQYYGWPPYWGAVLAEGGIGRPVMIPPPVPNPSSRELTDGNAPLRRAGDPRLRSARDTINYGIVAIDGAIGHVEDFLIDDVAWRVRYLVIDTRNWLPGRKVIVAPGWIRETSWETKTVHVDLTREEIKVSPPFDPAASWDPAYASALHDYYGRPRYSDWDEDLTAGAPKVWRKH